MSDKILEQQYMAETGALAILNTKDDYSNSYVLWLEKKVNINRQELGMLEEMMGYLNDYVDTHYRHECRENCDAAAYCDGREAKKLIIRARALMEAGK